MKNILVVIIIAVSGWLFSCKQGEQGDIGPAGSTGLKGLVGDKGEIGLTDSKGMQYSTWTEIKATDWDLRQPNYYAKQFTIPPLTQNIANKGNVYFYIQPSGSSIVYPLPHTLNDGVKFFGELFFASNTQLFVINHVINPTLGISKITSDYKFRLVILPAGSRISADVDMQNYDSVKKYLNLND